MKGTLLFIAVALLAAPAFAAKEKPAATETNLTSEQAEANYTQAIEKRTADILEVLALSDTNQAAKVHDAVIAQYRSLRAWHDANDDRLKQAAKDTNVVTQIQASLKALHDPFILTLSNNLTPTQVEQVKDKMTYGKVKVTYDAYLEIVPGLTDTDKARILELLKAAREEAMDCGSSKEKDAVFKKYKGKINNYLSTNGHDVAQAYKDWGAKQKARAATNSVPLQ
jgi:Protein of unknown function (DUF3826)